VRKSTWVGPRNKMNERLRWIAAYLAATILLSARPTIQAFLWISFKSGIETGQDFLRLFSEFPLLTLFLLRWDFFLALFPAALVVAVSWGVRRSLRARIIYSSIAVYFAASVIDVLHPAEVNPPIRIWFLLVSNLLLCPVFAVVIIYMANWFCHGARLSKVSIFEIPD
jgi:hypothetical protein